MIHQSAYPANENARPSLIRAKRSSFLPRLFAFSHLPHFVTSALHLFALQPVKFPPGRSAAYFTGLIPPSAEGLTFPTFVPSSIVPHPSEAVVLPPSSLVHRPSSSCVHLPLFAPSALHLFALHRPSSERSGRPSSLVLALASNLKRSALPSAEGLVLSPA